MTSEKVHEGERLAALLEQAGKKAADLGRAAAVSGTTAGRWLKMAELGPKAWDKVRRGLPKMGIDPWQVRPVDPSVSRFAREKPEELRQLIAGFGKKQLEQLLKILETSPDTQFILKVVISDRLAGSGRD